MLALEAGYGHADEQLFSMVYFDNRDIFEVYYGDYREMVTNYVEPVDRSFEPVRLLIAHSAAAGDNLVAERGCEALWNGWKKGTVEFSDNQLRELMRTYRIVRQRLGKGTALP